MWWVVGFVVATIVALIIEAIRFEKKMTGVSKTEAMRRLLKDEPKPPESPTQPASSRAGNPE